MVLLILLNTIAPAPDLPVYLGVACNVYIANQFPLNTK